LNRFDRLKKKYSFVVAWAHDNSTINAINEAVKNGFIEAIMLGNTTEIIKTCTSMSVDSNNYTILDVDNEIDASIKAVRMVKTGEADNVVSKDASECKGIKSAVAGEADILVTHDLNSGNILYKSLIFLSDGIAAAIITGASAPIILTSRTDSKKSKLFSIALTAALD
jgi:phosphotransacetylase